MNIEIKVPINDELIASSKVKFDLFFKKAYNFTVLLSVVGICCIVWSLFKKNEDLSIPPGSIFIIAAAVYFFHIYRSRMFYVGVAKRLVANCPENDKDIAITIEDDFFTYQTFEGKLQYKWCAFTNYKLINGALYLILNDNYLSSYTILEKELTKSELLSFYTFLNKTLREKK